MAKQGKLVGRRAGDDHRAGRRDRAGADGGMDGSRCPEADLAERRGGILVAFAQEVVAQGRGIRAYPESEGNPAGLRWRCDTDAGRTARRYRLSYRARKLFLPSSGKRTVGGNG